MLLYLLVFGNGLVKDNRSISFTIYHVWINTYTLTSLAVVLGPAATPEVSIDSTLGADGLTLGNSRTHISTLALILVGYDEVVLNRVQDVGPVQRSQVAQVWIFLNPHSTPGDVHQTVKTHLLQLQHLVNDKGIVEEEVVAANHSQVWEKIAQGLEAVDPEQQHIVGHDSQLWVAEAPEVFGLGLKHEQNLQVSLNDGAVFQRLEVRHIVPDVLALANWKDRKIQVKANIHRPISF